MGRTVEKLPLEERLKDIHRAGPGGNPFWIPEENPVLETWNLSLKEYWRGVKRNTGLDLEAVCGPVFRAVWPEKAGGDVNLIFLLGQAYRLTHPEAKGWEETEIWLQEELPLEDQPLPPPEPEDPADLLCYLPEPQAPAVWYRWNAGGPCTDGDPGYREQLESALFRMLLVPLSGAGGGGSSGEGPAEAGELERERR